MKKLMFLGLCALVMTIAKPAMAQIPDAAVIMHKESAMPLEVDLWNELAQPIHYDEGFVELFKQLFIGTDGTVKSKMEVFQEWVVQRDQPIEYQDLMEITDNKVIDISTNMAEIRKRIAFVLQFRNYDNTIFGFIQNGANAPIMVITLDYESAAGDGFPELHVKPMNRDCVGKGTRIINHV